MGQWSGQLVVALVCNGLVEREDFYLDKLWLGFDGFLKSVE